MANLKHAGSFTNRPRLRGQIDPDTGKEWIYTPDKPYWRDYEKDPVTHPETTMENGRAMIETPTFAYSGSMEDLPMARAMVERQDRMLVDAKEREERERRKAEEGPNLQQFTKMYDAKFGNPDNFNVKAEHAKAMVQKEKELRKGWGLESEDDLKFADPKVKKAFNDDLKAIDKSTYDETKDEQDRLYKHRDHAFKQFDKLVKAHKEQRERKFKETPGQKRAREEIYKIRTENRAQQRKIGEEIIKELRASGKKKELNRADIGVLTNAYLALMKEVKEGDEVKIKLRIKSINKIRTILGLGPMETKTTPGKDKFKILGIPIPYTEGEESKSYNMDFEKGKKQTFTKTATNPTTGEKVGWDGKKWIPIK